MRSKAIGFALAVLLGVAGGTPAHAQKQYGPGVTDTEIKIGNTTPYSGPVSAVQTTARTEAAYFKMINSRGGINGRKINFISLDDGYNPPKALEQVRKLVESDDVLAIVATPGTPPNLAQQKYLNQRQVPQLLIGSGLKAFDDAKNAPWSAPFTPAVLMEGFIYGKHVATEKPGSKVAVLYQNDDLGKSLLEGFKNGLGDKARIVQTASFEVSDPTVDSQVTSLHASGADVLVSFGAGKFAPQVVRKTHDLGWNALRIINWAASSVTGTLEPAGLDKSVGMVTATIFKSPTDPALKDNADVQEYLQFLKEWYPEAAPSDVFIVQGYIQAKLIVAMLQACGNNLTRENLLKQALAFKNFEVAMLMPGIKVNVQEGSRSLFQQMQLVRFDGKSWVRMGELTTAEGWR